MSAEIIKPTNLGVDATFWRLKFISIDRDPVNPQITIRIAGYASQEAFKAGSDYMVLRDYFLGGEEYAPLVNSLEGNPLTVDQLFQLMYAKTVLSDTYFEGATKL